LRLFPVPDDPFSHSMNDEREIGVATGTGKARLPPPDRVLAFFAVSQESRIENLKRCFSKLEKQLRMGPASWKSEIPSILLDRRIKTEIARGT